VAEDIHEEYDIIPFTDFNYLYVRSNVEIEHPLVKIGNNSNLSYFSIYDEILKIYMKFLKEVMINYAKRTISSDIEYMNIILEDGSYYILEGDERKVNVPFPKGITTSHTHPGICLFSYKDLETADSLFSIGYVVVSVMNTECISSLYRRGVYTFEDKLSLKGASNKLKKAKTMDDVVSIYKNLSFQNLKFITYQI